MIFIVVEHPVRPQYADDWPSLVEEFTASTRAEPGNICFDWFRSVEDPNLYVLVEAFQGKRTSTRFIFGSRWLRCPSGSPLCRKSSTSRSQVTAGHAWLKCRSRWKKGTPEGAQSAGNGCDAPLRAAGNLAQLHRRSVRRTVTLSPTSFSILFRISALIGNL